MCTRGSTDTQMYGYAVHALHNALHDPRATAMDTSLALWRCLICFQGATFTTSGRSGRPGVPFTYSVKRSGTSAGRHYTAAPDVDGYGNEIQITGITGGAERSGKQKTITRSTFDRALARTLELQKEGLDVAGPKKLGVYGASYIFAIFTAFGLVGGAADGAEEARAIAYTEDADGQIGLKL